MPFVKQFKIMSKKVHRNARSKGFWEDEDRNEGEIIAKKGINNYGKNTTPQTRKTRNKIGRRQRRGIGIWSRKFLILSSTATATPIF